MKYKVGDTFNCTVRIKDYDVDDKDFALEIVELQEEIGDVYFTQEDLDRAFDPHYAERERLKEIIKLKQRLKELESE